MRARLTVAVFAVLFAMVLAPMLLTTFTLSREHGSAETIVTERSSLASVIHLIAPGSSADSGSYGYQYCGYGNYVYNNGTDRDEYAGGYWEDLYTRRQTYNHWYKLWPWESGQNHFWHTYQVSCQP